MANLSLFTHPATFRRIKPQFLSEWLSPFREYLGQRGFTLPDVASRQPSPGAIAPPSPAPAGEGQRIDYERLAAVFMEPDAAMPRQLMHSASLIHEMANEDAMNALIEGAGPRNILLEAGDDPDPADVAVQMWLRDPELLEELHQLHQLDRPRAFVHFVTDRDPVPGFHEPADNQIAELEADLAEWYFKHKRGRSVRVWVYRRPNEFWFLVRHGLTSRRQEILSGSGSDTLIFRPGEYDVLAYNSERGELRIHGCNGKEVEKLRRAIGLHLFGDEEFFPGGAKFTLSPLLDAGRACLACRDIPGIEHITLTEFQVLARRGKRWLRTTQQSEDIFDALEDGSIALPSVEQIVRATFVVRFSDSTKQRTVKIMGSNKLSVVRDGDTALVEQWLLARGFVLSITRDDETGIVACT